MVRALVAYDGTAFAGFQRQPEARTVQGEIEKVLADLYGQFITVHGAGRTDAGVHARGQVVAWRAPLTIPPERVAIAANGRLPADVALRDSERAPEGFDPRRWAVSRRYRYRFVEDRLREPLRDRVTTRVEPGLDLAAMQEATALFVGSHEFRSFCTLEAGDESPTQRSLIRAEWIGGESVPTIEWEARSFLRKQVRCMMGALFAVGRGECAPERIEAMLAGAPWPSFMSVAAPQGLVLEQVVY